MHRESDTERVGGKGVGKGWGRRRGRCQRGRRQSPKGKMLENTCFQSRIYGHVSGLFKRYQQFKFTVYSIFDKYALSIHLAQIHGRMSLLEVKLIEKILRDFILGKNEIVNDHPLINRSIDL